MTNRTRKIFLLTDIPVWVQPLAKAFEDCGARVTTAETVETVIDPDTVVNRISTRVARRFPDRAEAFVDALRKWEDEGVRVVNGADCLRIGFSKLEQMRLFASCDVATPRTASLQAGRRGFPEIPVLIKPPAGGFGKGIRSLAANEEVPEDCGGRGWIEQEKITPVDGAVHRVEILGTDILYEAATPIVEEEFNYCLANTEDRSNLTAGTDLSLSIRDSVLKITHAAGMEIGAVEYLLGGDDRPVFIDLNPVSSLHPKARDLLGEDPLRLTAEYILSV